MSKIRITRNTFNGGVISPMILGNVDIEQYNNSMKECFNMYKVPGGGLSKRVGTDFILDITKYAGDGSERIFPFVFSPSVSYLVHFSFEAIATGKVMNCTLFGITPLAKPQTEFSCPIPDTWDVREIHKHLQFCQNKSRGLAFLRDRVYEITVGIDPTDPAKTIIKFKEDKYSVAPLGLPETGDFMVFFPDSGNPYGNVELGIGIIVKRNLWLKEKYNKWVGSEYWRKIDKTTYRVADNRIYPKKTTITPGENEAIVPAPPWRNDNKPETVVEFFNWIKNADILSNDEKNELKLDAEDLEKLREVYTGVTEAVPKSMLVTYSSSDVARPTLGWGLMVDKVYTDAESGLPDTFCFHYTRVEEYCPKGQVSRKTEKDAKIDYMDVLSVMPFPVCDNNVLEHPVLPRFFLNAQHPASIRLPVLTESERGFMALAHYEGRLYMANAMSEPSMLFGSSRTYQDWLNFLPGGGVGDAIVEILAGNNGQVFIEWMIGAQKLFIGTSDGIYVMGGASSQSEDALTPLNARAKKLSSVIAGRVPPIMAMDTVFFVDGSGRHVYEICLSEGNSMYAVNELTALSREVYSSGIVSHTYAQVPARLHFSVLENGDLISIAYMKSMGTLATTVHRLGGWHEVGSSKAEVKGAYHVNVEGSNYVVLDVRRKDRMGNITRTLETMSYVVSEEESLRRNNYVDLGIELMERMPITGLATGSSAAVTFSNEENGLLCALYAKVRAICFLDDHGIVDPKSDIFLHEQVLCGVEFHGKYPCFLLGPNNDDEEWYDPEDAPDVQESLLLTASLRFDFQPNIESRLGRFDFVEQPDGYVHVFFRGLVSSSFPLGIRQSVMFRGTDLKFSNGDPVDNIVGLYFELRKVAYTEEVVLYRPNPTVAKLMPGSKFTKGTISFVCKIVDGGVRGVYFPPQRTMLSTLTMITIPDNTQCLMTCYDFSDRKIEKDIIVVSQRADFRYEVLERYKDRFGVWRNRNMKWPVILSLSYIRGGFLLKKYNGFVKEDVPACYRGRMATIILDDDWYACEIDADGVVTCDDRPLGGDEYWSYLRLGLKYESSFETTALFAQSPVHGSTLWNAATAVSTTLHVYNSAGGEVGITKDALYPIRYTGVHAHARGREDLVVQPAGCSTSREGNLAVCFRHDVPAPFNLLSITQEVDVTDGNPH